MTPEREYSKATSIYTYHDCNLMLHMLHLLFVMSQHPLECQWLPVLALHEEHIRESTLTTPPLIYFFSHFVVCVPNAHCCFPFIQLCPHTFSNLPHDLDCVGAYLEDLAFLLPTHELVE